MKRILLIALLLIAVALSGSACNLQADSAVINGRAVTLKDLQSLISANSKVLNVEENYYNSTGDINSIDQTNTLLNLPCLSSLAQSSGVANGSTDIASINCSVLQYVYAYALNDYVSKLPSAASQLSLAKAYPVIKKTFLNLGMTNSQYNSLSPNFKRLAALWYVSYTNLSGDIISTLEFLSLKTAFNLFKNAFGQTCFSYVQVPTAVSGQELILSLQNNKSLKSAKTPYGKFQNLGCAGLQETGSQLSSLAGYTFNLPVGSFVELSTSAGYAVIKIDSRKTPNYSPKFADELKPQLNSGISSPLLSALVRKTIYDAIASSSVSLSPQFGSLISVSNQIYVCSNATPPLRFVPNSASLRSSIALSSSGSVLTCPAQYRF